MGSFSASERPDQLAISSSVLKHPRQNRSASSMRHKLMHGERGRLDELELKLLGIGLLYHRIVALVQFLTIFYADP